MKCEICKKRKAIIDYSPEPTFALTHGFGIQHICRQCFIKKIKKHLRDCKKQLQEQKKILAKEVKNERHKKNTKNTKKH